MPAVGGRHPSLGAGPGQFHHAFTGEYGGLWRRNGRPSGALVGLVMSSQGFDVCEAYRLGEAVRDTRVAFMFDGLDATPGRDFGGFGLAGGGAAGLEIDRTDAALGTPAHALVLGSSMRHTDIYLMAPEDLLDPTPDMTGTQSDMIRSDMVFFETAGGGAVFSTGSIAWAAAMAASGYDNEVAKVTTNVLRRFADPEPFLLPTPEREVFGEGQHSPVAARRVRIESTSSGPRAENAEHTIAGSRGPFGSLVRVHPASGGDQPGQPISASRSTASARRSSSRPMRPTSCAPIGTPSRSWSAGTERAAGRRC